jgi:hypothetical protein
MKQNPTKCSLNITFEGLDIYVCRSIQLISVDSMDAEKNVNNTTESGFTERQA